MRGGRAFAVAALLAALPAAAQTSNLAEDAIFKQSAAVLAHYPDLPVKLATPALAPGRANFTTQEEMEAFVGNAAKRSQRASVVEGYKSQQGRAIPIVILSSESAGNPAALRALKRPIVWFIGQQHGNEPAGGEAMLALISALADGELASVLDKVIVVVVPRANPDGAALFTRATASKSDLNRDHLQLSLPESRSIHAAMMLLPPDVVFDHHEFSVANRWVEKFGGLQASDAMMLYATHPNVPPDVVALAKDIYMPSVEAALARNNLTSILYHTTSFDSADKLVSMGGNAPGIARNLFGLMNAVSFLVETRGVGIGMDSYQRRVATHYLVAKAVLETTLANIGKLQDGLARGRDAAAKSSASFVVAHKLGQIKLDLPLRDPVSGERKIVSVAFQDSRLIEPGAMRARPAGYSFPAASDDALKRLELNNVSYCYVGAGGDIDAENYVVKSRAAKTGPAINPDAAMQVELTAARIHVGRGDIFVPLNQPAAGLIEAALEPDSPGSLSGVGLLGGGDRLALTRAGARPSVLLAPPAAAQNAALCN